jgi:hypothetical protein
MQKSRHSKFSLFKIPHYSVIIKLVEIRGNCYAFYDAAISVFVVKMF